MKPLEMGEVEMGTLAHMVRKIDFFTPLTVGQLDNVLPAIMLYAFDAGETVFSQGQEGDAFYIIYKGTVDVRLRRWLVLSKKVATLKAGDFLGEIALVSNEPRTATVVCAEPTLLFTLSSADFKFVLQESPSAAKEMKRLAARRTFDTSRQAAS